MLFPNNNTYCCSVGHEGQLGKGRDIGDRHEGRSAKGDEVMVGPPRLPGAIINIETP